MPFQTLAHLYRFSSKTKDTAKYLHIIQTALFWKSISANTQFIVLWNNSPTFLIPEKVHCLYTLGAHMQFLWFPQNVSMQHWWHNPFSLCYDAVGAWKLSWKNYRALPLLLPFILLDTRLYFLHTENFIYFSSEGKCERLYELVHEAAGQNWFRTSKHLTLSQFDINLLIHVVSGPLLLQEI